MAASILLKGMTVEYLFERLYKIKKDEFILFHAAAGGVGLIASQWARSVGCKMIGTVSNDEKVKLAMENGFTMAVHVLRSESTGTSHIKNSNPTNYPQINFNFLSNKNDCLTLLKGIKIVRTWINSESMTGIKGLELAPGPNIQDDESLLNWVRATAETTYHPVGTCKMGNDRAAVVDHELKIHGLKGVRIADASIMPTLTSGNTNAPTIMIAEKAASMILNPS